MKNLLVAILCFICVASTCKNNREVRLKEELIVKVTNNTNKEFKNAMLYVLAGDESIADSIHIPLPRDEEMIVKWQPRLKSSTGFFELVLEKGRGINLWYYNGYAILDKGPFEIIINDDECIVKQLELNKN